MYIILTFDIFAQFQSKINDGIGIGIGIIIYIYNKILLLIIIIMLILIFYTINTKIININA